MNAQLEQNLIQRLAVGDIVRRSAHRVPDKEALVEYRGGVKISYTYRELNQAVNKFARAMRVLGLEKGDKVVAIYLNSVEYIISFFGLARGGYIMVPINPGLSPENIDYIVNHSEARALLIDDVFIPVVSKHLNKMKNIKGYISVPVSGQKAEDPFVDFQGFISGHPADDIEDVVIWDRDILQIMYTGGTTGAPKGVMLNNLSVYVAALQNAVDVNITSDSVMTIMMPLFQNVQQALLVSAMLVGSKAVVMRGFDPNKFIDLFEVEKFNWVALPITYRAVFDHPRIDEYDFSRFEVCVYSIKPREPNALEGAREKFSGASLILATGQTEAYPSTNFYNPVMYAGKEGNYWGFSNLTYETAVMNDQGNILPKGQVGEIVWRGPGIMDGYYKDEEATREARKFGWHHSGDLGYFDEDGLLVFVDRKRDMIRTDGGSVYSIKLERALMGHPQIEGVAVVGLPDSDLNEAVTVFVVPKEGSGLTEHDILAWCKKELGEFEVPKSVVLVNSLPRTASGKLRKYEIRHKYRDIYQE